MISPSRTWMVANGFMEMFGAWEMKNLGIEEEREMYGLLIVAAWMAAVSWAAWRRKHLSG